MRDVLVLVFFFCFLGGLRPRPACQWLKAAQLDAVILIYEDELVGHPADATVDILSAAVASAANVEEPSVVFCLVGAALHVNEVHLQGKRKKTRYGHIVGGASRVGGASSQWFM